ncbi:MAG: hypothetical protein M3Y87_01600 [Myxococcota bacterium]|nr:hypothetical protein [Myxococcota bacterium]
MSNATLELSLQFAALARRPDVRRLGRRWDVCIEVDGTLHVFEEGPRHSIAMSPGAHDVAVWFRGAGVALLARFMRLGSRKIRVEAAPGATVRLVYVGSTFWHMGGAAELRLA